MAKIVKIPLVMKNGAKATDMKSLIANFDVESVIGYFLDGKLEKWLNDRYYEEEAEAIAKIEKDDPTLAKQLCDIFGIEYEAAAEIDAEEIARRNERIARLKQLTDDEEVLQNVDAVAFDQEDLAELYDKGVKKIYLCEGEFRIPKSKQDLEYTLIGSASATGMQIKKLIIEEEEEDVSSNPYINSSIIKIPEKVTDKIAMNPYVLLDDYVVYYEECGLFGRFFSLKSILGENQAEDGFFKVWNIKTGSESSFNISEYDSIDAAYGMGNTLILHDRSKDGILLYNVDTKKKSIVCTDYSNRSGFSVSEGAIAYTNSDGQLFVYNISAKTKQKVADLGYTPDGHNFILDGRKLLYHNTVDSTFCVYNVAEKTKTKLFDMDNHLIMQNVSYNGKVFLLMYNVYDNYVALWSVDLVNLEDKPIEHFRFDVENSFGLERLKQIAPYFIYVKAEYGFPVYAFNMITQELTQVATECGHTYREEGGLFKKATTTYFANSFQVVGNYLYFKRGESDICRINFSDTDEPLKTLQ